MTGKRRSAREKERQNIKGENERERGWREGVWEGKRKRLFNN